MRKPFLLLLSGALFTACVDKNFDLSDIDTEDITIGDEFRGPLATISVSMDEIADNGVNIEQIFGEADAWLPDQLPDKDSNGSYADLEKLLNNDTKYISDVLDALIGEMVTSSEKLDEVTTLLSNEKYVGPFLDKLPPGTTVNTFKKAFTDAFLGSETLRNELSREVKALAYDYLTSFKVEPIEYSVGHVDISDDVVDMIADNLDPEGTANAKRTLHLYGQIASDLPVTLLLSPQLYPTDVAFEVPVNANSTANKIDEIRLYAGDLRQIVDGITLRMPVALKKYYPRKGFQNSAKSQIEIQLRIVKRGGLKLDI